MSRREKRGISPAEWMTGRERELAEVLIDPAMVVLMMSTWTCGRCYAR